MIPENREELLDPSNKALTDILVEANDLFKEGMCGRFQSKKQVELVAVLVAVFFLNTNDNKFVKTLHNNFHQHAQNQPGTDNLYRFTHRYTLIRLMLQQCPLVAMPPHCGTRRP